MIYRTNKNNKKFVQIDSDIVNNPNLSFKAKGILLYMLSKPDNWIFYDKEIINHAKDGVKSIQSGIKELKKEGYFKKIPLRDDSGKIIKWLNNIYENPGLSSNVNSRIPKSNNLDTNYIEDSNKEIINNSENEFSAFSLLKKKDFSFWYGNQNIIPDIYKYIFEIYPKYTGKNHPRIKDSQLQNILDRYEVFYKRCGDEYRLYYESLLSKFTKSETDYNINHLAEFIYGYSVKVYSPQ